MAKKNGTEENKLANVATSQLIEYLQMIEVVCDYYDNEAKANVGNYYGDEKEAYENANSRFLKYLKLRMQILEEMERRLDVLC